MKQRVSLLFCGLGMAVAALVQLGLRFVQPPQAEGFALSPWAIASTALAGPAFWLFAGMSAALVLFSSGAAPRFRAPALGLAWQRWCCTAYCWGFFLQACVQAPCFGCFKTQLSLWSPAF